MLRPVLPILLLALPLAAQGAPFGTWTLAAPTDITPMVEKATEAMNFIKKPIARSRLKKTNTVHQRVIIAKAGSEFTVQFDERAPMRMPADGQPVKWTREDGEVFQLSGRIENNDLVQTFKAEDGERVNVFHADGRNLTLTVTVRSPQLPAPLVYTLAYRN